MCRASLVALALSFFTILLCLQTQTYFNPPSPFYFFYLFEFLPQL